MLGFWQHDWGARRPFVRKEHTVPKSCLVVILTVRLGRTEAFCKKRAHRSYKLLSCQRNKRESPTRIEQAMFLASKFAHIHSYYSVPETLRQRILVTITSQPTTVELTSKVDISTTEPEEADNDINPRLTKYYMCDSAAARASVCLE